MKIGKIIDKIKEIDINEIEITKKRIIVLILIVLGVFVVSSMIGDYTQQNNVINGIINPQNNSKQLNVNDSTLYIETDPGLSGYIAMYTFNDLPNNKSYESQGIKHTIYFENGTGSFKVNEDPDVKYFALNRYGHLNQNVGYSSAHPLYGKLVKITYNGKTLTNSKVYSTQFDISDGDYFVSLSTVNDLTGKKIKITN